MNRILLVAVFIMLGCSSQSNVQQSTSQPGQVESRTILVKVKAETPKTKQAKTVKAAVASGQPLRPAKNTVAFNANSSESAHPVDNKTTEETVATLDENKLDKEELASSDTEQQNDKIECTAERGPNPCPTETIIEWQKSISTSYEKLLEALNPAEHELLVSSQQQWELFMENEKHFIYQLLQKNSLVDVDIYQSYIEELFKARAQDLLKYLIKVQ